jgi:hypothetical protein
MGSFAQTLIQTPLDKWSTISKYDPKGYENPMIMIWAIYKSCSTLNTLQLIVRK